MLSQNQRHHQQGIFAVVAGKIATPPFLGVKLTFGLTKIIVEAVVYHLVECQIILLPFAKWETVNGNARMGMMIAIMM